MIPKESDKSNHIIRNGDFDGRPQAKGLLDLFHRHPVASSAVGTFVLDGVLVILASMAVTAFVPSSVLKTTGGPGLLDFLALCVTTIATVILVSFLRWWRLVGYNRPAEWRDLWILLLPAVAVLMPLVGGFKAVDTGTLIFLLVGYLLTGFYGETLFRGVVLRVLQPKGV